MSLTARIASHLPYLRRYARAVTGSQASGDAYVAAALEALIADLSVFPKASSDRVALYKLFVSLAGSIRIDVTSQDSPFGWERRAADNLARLPSQERHAFLLVSVEGFSIPETAEILGVDENRVAALINEASEAISRQVATDILIIEDEPLIALDI